MINLDSFFQLALEPRDPILQESYFGPTGNIELPEKSGRHEHRFDARSSKSVQLGAQILPAQNFV